jgi:predicted GTPase
MNTPSSPDGSGSREFEQRILEVMPQVIRVALGAGERDVVARLDAVQAQLQETGVTIVVLGQFSSGKSTLLNALLEEPEGIFPVDSYLSTRVVTSARWGQQETITLTLAARPGAPAESRGVGRAELRAYISEAEVQDGTAAPEADRVRSVSIETPNPKLRDGVVLIDTPGVGGVVPGHTEATLGVLSQPDADMVLYALDAGRLPLPSELAFIERVATAVDARRSPERLLFAVTKADSEDDWDALEREARARLSAVPGIGEGSTIFPVSSDSRLRQLAGDEPPDDTLTGFGRFEARLWGDADRARLRLRTGAALAELDLAVQSLLAPVRSALEVLDADDDAARAELEASVAKQRAEAERLAEGSADWPEELRTALDGVATSLSARATADLSGLWRTVRADYRRNKKWLDDPQLILDEMAGRLALLVGELGQAAAWKAAEACDGVAARCGLRIHGPALDGVPLPPLPDRSQVMAAGAGRVPLADNMALAFEAARAGAQAGAKAGGMVGDFVWDQAVSYALGSSKTAGKMVDGAMEKVMGSALEKVMGAESRERPGDVVGRVVGSVVGAVLAFASKARAITKMDKGQRVGAFDELFEPWEAEQRSFLHDAIRQIVGAYEAAAEADLRSRIAQRQAECKAAASEVAAALQAAGSDSAAARKELTARAKELEEIQRTVAALAGELRAHLASR